MEGKERKLDNEKREVTEHLTLPDMDYHQHRPFFRGRAREQCISFSII